MMMHRKADRHEHIRMEFRRFLESLILIPAAVMRHARTITVRLIGYTPSLDRLVSVWRTIERTRFGLPQPIAGRQNTTAHPRRRSHTPTPPNSRPDRPTGPIQRLSTPPPTLARTHTGHAKTTINMII